MSISKSKRFEVFKRDKFTCQYCGGAAPNVLLEVDHIVPKAEDGSDDILNLLTSCADCNRGKGARLLSDDSVVAKQRKQLEELQERREQLEMMIDWQRSLIGMEEQAINELTDLWDELVPGYTLNQRGIQSLRRWMTRFEIPELFECMKISVAQYLRWDDEDDGKPTHGSVEKALQYIPKIAGRRRKIKEKPYLEDLFYILHGVLEKRLGLERHYRHEAIDIMEEAYLHGMTIGEIKRLAHKSTSYWSFKSDLEEKL